MPKPKADWMKAVAVASSAGFTLLGCICLGVFIGIFVDSFFYVHPWGLVVFSLLGGFTGFWALYKQVLGK